jgi:hypothetical protein
MDVLFRVYGGKARAFPKETGNPHSSLERAEHLGISNIRSQNLTPAAGSEPPTSPAVGKKV